MRQYCLQFIETRFTETDGAVSNHTGDCSAHRVVGGFSGTDSGLHAFAGFGVRASSDFLVDLFSRDGVDKLDVLLGQYLIVLFRVEVGRVLFSEWNLDLAGLTDECDNLDAVRFQEELFRNCTCGDSTDRFPRRGSSATAGRLESVFCEVGKVSVGRTREEVGFRVVMWSLILVLNDQADGCAECDAVFGSGLDGDRVVF